MNSKQALWCADKPQCDEQRPGCLRCATANSQCPGYFQETKFLDEGAGLRRKFHYGENRDVLTEESQSPGPVSEGSPGLAVVLDKSGNGSCQLTRYVAHDDTNLRFEKTSNETPESERQTTTSSSFVDLVNGPHVANVGETTPSDASMPTLRGSVEDYENIPDIGETPKSIFGSSGIEPLRSDDESWSENVRAVFPTTSKTFSKATQSQQASRGDEENTFKVLFLIRHFSETVGPW